MVANVSLNTPPPSSPPRPITITPAASSPSDPTRARHTLNSPPPTSCRSRANPSVTPRRFARFFTPRPALIELRGGALFRHQQSANGSSPDTAGASPHSKRHREVSDEVTPPRKRRPSARYAVDAAAVLAPNVRVEARRPTIIDVDINAPGPVATGLVKKSSRCPKIATTIQGCCSQPVRSIARRGQAAELLLRELGSGLSPGHDYLAHPVSDSRVETADFVTTAANLHVCNSCLSTSDTMPFSLATCKGATISAVGDDEGFVRFLDTSPALHPPTSVTTTAGLETKASFQCHPHAIMDLAFSEDDLRLATAGSDCTARVVDVMTQQVAADLVAAHHGSLRRVAFQPGAAGGSVLATSDNNGRIQIWDLRCGSGPVARFSAVAPPPRSPPRRIPPPAYLSRNPALPTAFPRPVNTIEAAHTRTSASPASVTALQWFPTGQEHLLLSASEAGASIRLWDVRCLRSRRSTRSSPAAMPLCATLAALHPSHQVRPFGLTSLALSADASRLYTLCRDSTVYVYSASHLILGHAPELSRAAAHRRPAATPASPPTEGLSPLYGLRHPLLRVDSWFVRCALRASTASTELLAVGSSAGCAILIPTLAHTRHFVRPAASEPSDSPIPLIHHAGTALVRGHLGEVTAPGWASDGGLVTASDDRTVRYWRQDAQEARRLRTCGEFGGSRHQAGWADVDGLEDGRGGGGAAPENGWAWDDIGE